MIHSDDAFAPVGYIRFKKLHLEDKVRGHFYVVTFSAIGHFYIATFSAIGHVYIVTFSARGHFI